MYEVITLVGYTWEGATKRTTRRDVLCGLHSIGQREFYEANATDFHPEMKFILADFLDYQDETKVIYKGTAYRVLRTYRTGQSLELTVERAPDEEAVV